MIDAAVVNLFFTLRVIIVGGFLLILPRITRKGLLFGAYVGEAVSDRDAAGRLLGGWYRGCVILMALSLMVGYGISWAGRPVTGNLTGTAFLLLGGFVLYLLFHFRARRLAPPAVAQQGQKAVAALTGGEPKGAGSAKFALVICLLAGFATFAYAALSYETMSAREPTSFLTVMFVPSLNLVLNPFVALIALLTANAKRSVRGGSGGRSVEAQDAFRATMTNVLSGTAILACAFMTVLSVLVIRIGLSETDSSGLGIWLAAAVLFVAWFAFTIGSLIRIVKGYGQGGALLETGSVEAPLTDGLADNARWVWGLFYVDRNDPSIMVESRIGIGYTLNYGNPTAILIVAGFVVLSLSVAAFVLIGTLVGGG